MSFVRRSLAAAFVLVLATVSTATADPTPLGCRRAIVKAANKYGVTYAKSSSACWLQVVLGKTMPPCPDQKAFDKIGKASDNLAGAITKACDGLTVADAGFSTNCPGIDDGNSNVLASIDDVITCVRQVQARAAFSFTEELFQNLANGTEAAEKCRAAVGKTGVKLYDVNAKALAKCEDLVLKGKATGPCPDVKASETFAAASAKARTAVCKACGGKDKACDGVDDVAVADVGFTFCPFFNFQGASCGGPNNNLTDLGDCLVCTAGSRTSCADFAAAQPADVPADCDPVCTGDPSVCGP